MALFRSDRVRREDPIQNLRRGKTRLPFKRDRQGAGGWREKRNIEPGKIGSQAPRSHRRIDAFLPGEDLFRKRGNAIHKRFKQQQNSHNQIGRQVRRDRYRYYRRRLSGHVRRRLRKGHVQQTSGHRLFRRPSIHCRHGKPCDPQGLH